MPKCYDIILIPFPFTDLSSVKLRPALVVANPYGKDIIVAFISSKSGTPHKTDVKVSASKQNGLKKASVVNCGKLATLDQGMIVGKLGALEKNHHPVVQKKFAALFNVK